MYTARKRHPNAELTAAMPSSNDAGHLSDELEEALQHDSTAELVLAWDVPTERPTACAVIHGAIRKRAQKCLGYVLHLLREQEGYDPHACGVDGHDAAAYACKVGNYDAVTVIVEFTKSIPATTYFEVIQKGPVRDALWLRNFCHPGQLRMSKDAKGYTILHVAVRRGDKDLVSMLLDCNVNVKCHRGQTPLLVALLCGFHGCATLLKGGMAQLDTIDNKGLTTLHAAVMSGCPECVKWVLEAIADKKKFEEYCRAQDVFGNTPFHYASSVQALDALLFWSGNACGVECILEILEICNTNGETPVAYMLMLNQNEKAIHLIRWVLRSIKYRGKVDMVNIVEGWGWWTRGGAIEKEAAEEAVRSIGEMHIRDVVVDENATSEERDKRDRDEAARTIDVDKCRKKFMFLAHRYGRLETVDTIRQLEV